MKLQAVNVLTIAMICSACSPIQKQSSAGPPPSTEEVSSDLSKAQVAGAIPIIACGSEQGYAYFDVGGYVTKEKAGWATDGFSTGRVILVKRNGSYDIVIGTDDQAGATAADSNLQVVEDGPQAITITMVSHAMATRVDVFSFVRGAEGTTLEHLESLGSPLQKGAAYVSHCTERGG